MIRGHIIVHTSHHKKSKTWELIELENIIKQAETELKQQVTQDGMRKLKKLKYQYNNIITQKVKFNIFRERQTYFEAADKAGKLLANYVKQRVLASTIPAVRLPVGDLLTATVDVNQAFKEFCSNLYS